MARWLIPFVLLGFVVTVAAQGTPQIVSFTVDDPVVNYTATEAGVETAVFTWEAVNLRRGDTMRMDAWVGGAWVLIGEGFEPAKSDELVIAHPAQFGNPRYRLSILDATGAIVAAEELELQYSAPTAPTRVDWVKARAYSVAPGDVTEPLLIHWHVANRPPNANLVFEQVLPNGEVVNIEMGEQKQWYNAFAEGTVQPQDPGAGYDVVLRLRVVDQDTGITLASRDSMVPVADRNQPRANLNSFTVTPQTATPGDEVTLTWDIENGQRVFITERIMRAPEAMDCKHAWTPDKVYEYLPAQGGITVTLPTDTDDVTSVRYQIIYQSTFTSDWVCVPYNAGPAVQMAYENGQFSLRDSQ